MPVTKHIETPLQLHCVTFGGTLRHALPVKHGERICRISTSAANLVASLTFVTNVRSVHLQPLQLDIKVRLGHLTASPSASD